MEIYAHVYYDIGDGNVPGGGIHKPYKSGGELMLEANFGKEEYLSVKWVFRKYKR